MERAWKPKRLTARSEKPEPEADDYTVLLHLGNQLLKGYCKSIADIAAFSRSGLSQLNLAICVRWDLEPEQVPSVDTLRDAFREKIFTKATLEKLAMLLAAITDEECGKALIDAFLKIPKRGPVVFTPHWNCFAENFRKEEPPKVPRIILYEPLDESLKGLEKSVRNELKILLERIDLEERGGK